METTDPPPTATHRHPYTPFHNRLYPNKCAVFTLNSEEESKPYRLENRHLKSVKVLRLKAKVRRCLSYSNSVSNEFGLFMTTGLVLYTAHLCLQAYNKR